MRRETLRRASWPAGENEMARRIREHDWAKTPLGPLEYWPQSLKTAVEMALAMPGPATILWGPEHVQLYNDAYVAVARDRHPGLLGLPAEEGWPDAYEGVIAPLLDAVRLGRPTELADYPVSLRAPDGRLEERVFDTAFSPVRDESGGVAGVLQTLVEVTGRRRAEEALREGEERQAFLLGLSDALRAEPSADAVANRALRMLSEQMRLDRCYIAAYRVEDDRADFTHQVGNDSVPPLPDSVRLSEFPDAFEQVRNTTFVVEDDFERQGLSEAERANSKNLGMHAMLASTVRKGEKYPLSSLMAVSARPRRWTRGEIALVEEVAERTWAAMERARADEALRESEEKYRSLFDSIDEGLAVVEMIYDDEGDIVDMIFRQTNSAYERQGGVYDVVGRSIAEVLPGVEDYWLDLYKKVARTGEAVRVEDYQQDVGRWFDVFFSRVDEDGRFVAIVFNDISERKRAEQALRQSEERQAFLLKLSDALRPLADPTAIQAAATRLLRERFDAGWCYYAEYDAEGRVATVLEDAARDGLPSLAGRHDVSDIPEYIAFLRTTRMFNTPDIASDQLISPQIAERYTSIGVRAMLGVALVKEGGELPSLFLVDTTPRPWPQEAVDLIGEVAERTWAAVERAKAEAALRESEERLRIAAEAAWLGRWELVPGTGTLTGDEVFGAQHGSPPGVQPGFEGHLDAMHPEDREEVRRRVAAAVGGREGYEAEYRVPLPDGSTRWIMSHGRFIPGPDRLVGVTLDASGRHELERERELARARELTALAEAAERERISRELHDRVAHHMGVAHQSLELYSALKEAAPDRAAERLKLAREATRLALDQTRALSAELKRLQDEELEEGLKAAFGKLAESYVPDGIGVEISFSGEEARIPGAVGTQAYLAMREAIRNAVRHSGCSRIGVSLRVEDGKLYGLVEDDGEGFDPEAVRKATPSWGVGLRSMRERAEMLGGTLRVDSKPGAGTRAELRVPLEGWRP